MILCVIIGDVFIKFINLSAIVLSLQIPDSIVTLLYNFLPLAKHFQKHILITENKILLIRLIERGYYTKFSHNKYNPFVDLKVASQYRRTKSVQWLSISFATHTQRHTHTHPATFYGFFCCIILCLFQ